MPAAWNPHMMAKELRMRRLLCTEICQVEFYSHWGAQTWMQRIGSDGGSTELLLSEGSLIYLLLRGEKSWHGCAWNMLQSVSFCKFVCNVYIQYKSRLCLVSSQWQRYSDACHNVSGIALLFWEPALILKVGRAKAEGCAPLFLWKFCFRKQENWCLGVAT